MSRIAVGLSVLSALLAGCASGVSPTIDCGPASALAAVPNSDLAGAPLGPLLIRGAYGDSATTAVVYGFESGHPTKMLALIARDMDSDIALTGFRCDDRKPLRFYMNQGAGPWTMGPGGTPVPEEVMSSSGDLRAVLPKLLGPGRSGVTSYGGYFLFPTAGTYRIEAFSDGSKIGEATIMVRSEPYH